MVGPTASTPTALSRLGAAAVGAALGFLAVWICQRNLGHPTWDGWIFWVPLTLLLTTLAALCWWFALRGDRPESRAAMRASWRGGLLVGALGFALGFVGPLVITPSANLGPLLGILLTGPLGFVGGAVGALGFWKLRSP
jgi:hypothetical protein